ncbi:MAG: ABC transporter substrate-binding protein [Deltaproteobacteria bacterium]|nr:ABC transporter substrate-binding protein [Deltaproteobacteria bacterium]MBI2532534.1 ABC transporter substrate-binding protein [Deltaproteobacteria bacterium]
MDQRIAMRFWSAVALALAVPALAPSPAAHAERVRTVIPRSTVNYLSLPVADVKGFFRAEGLENETIVIPGTTAIAALVSGNVDYSGAGGTGMRAALRGAPIKAVMFQAEKVTWYLLAASDIQKISDLKGKRVAVGTVGDTQDTLITISESLGLPENLRKLRQLSRRVVQSSQRGYAATKNEKSRIHHEVCHDLMLARRE